MFETWLELMEVKSKNDPGPEQHLIDLGQCRFQGKAKK